MKVIHFEPFFMASNRLLEDLKHGASQVAGRLAALQLRLPFGSLDPFMSP